MDTALQVRVVTGAKSFSVDGFDEWTGELRVKLESNPVKGRANKELTERLSKILDAEVELLSGEKSTRKRLLVRDKTLEELRGRLGF